MTALPATAPATALATAPALDGLLPDTPPIAALFLIEFDAKAGYTIVWKQADAGIDLTGAVEYKSLPSGLHTVSEDLVYFVHHDSADADADANANDDADASRTGYAGLSAFVNQPTDDAGARNARMIAVGVLVPRSYGRLGRAWQHAGGLLEMARKLAADATLVPLLDTYWKDNSSPQTLAETPTDDQPHPLVPDAPGVVPPMVYQPPPLPLAPGSRLSVSDSTALLLPPTHPHHLSPHHPAWSLTALLDTFGPLVFPIYRAALLRKRILISTHAPVREVNNFVYILSVLANIPHSALDVVDPAAAAHLQRIRPLFTIGVNDIGFIMDDYAASKRAARQAGLDGGDDVPYNGPGWIACTTDSILAVKSELWDVLITMPPTQAVHAPTSATTTTTSTKKVWPTVEVAKGVPLKASQRDLRRFKSLMSTLGAAGPGTRLLQLEDPAEAVVEPVTWAALAYNGFMWWASAGEQGRSADETDEAIHDAQLLADIVAAAASNEDDRNPSEEEERARIELATITYFHRLTTQILSVLSDVVESSEAASDGAYYDEEEEEEEVEDGEAHYDEATDGTVEDDAALDGNVDGSNDDDDYDADDGLVGARRSAGLASTTPSSSLPSARQSTSSSTALLLQRRDNAGASSPRRRRRPGQQHRTRQQQQRRHRRRQTGGPSSPTSNTSSLRVTSDEVKRMGLDVWSRADAAFVQRLAQQYFGRRSGSVHVESKGVEVCGLKVC